MKTHLKNLKLVEFFFVLVFFVLPPIFSLFFPSKNDFQNQNSAQNFSSAIYSPKNFLNALFALFLFFEILQNEKKLNSAKQKIPQNKKTKILFFSILIFEHLAAFSAILLVNAIFQFLSIIRVISAPKISVFLPKDSVANCIICLFFVFCAAFYEEILYRKYLPETFYQFCTVFLKNRKKLNPRNLKSQKKYEQKYERSFLKAKIFCESLAILIFAISHANAGAASAFYAFFCAIIFRIFVKKTNLIFSASILHFFHNVLAILFSL